MAYHDNSRDCTQEQNFFRREDGLVLCFSCHQSPSGCFCKEKWKEERSTKDKENAVLKQRVKVLEEALGNLLRADDDFSGSQNSEIAEARMMARRALAPPV